MFSRRLRKALALFLFPVSMVYGIVIAIRNIFFDLNVLKSVEFDVPVISVGNITVGGTGKTPHVEYLFELISEQHIVAMLSRGYRRKTQGFILAGAASKPEDIGDEPYQVFSKFRKIKVAVDTDRVSGVRQLKKKIKNLQAVVLDDAFQHRTIKPGISIVLIDYYRPIFKDFLLPMGDLRECKSSISRANIVIVTKVPHEMLLVERETWKKKLKLLPHQSLYFTSFEYGDLTPVFREKTKKVLLSDLERSSTSVILVTGIANPRPLIEKIQTVSSEVLIMQYADHHNYTGNDLKDIHKKYNSLGGENKIIVTTEKDAVKLGCLKFIEPYLREKIYYLPIKVRFIDNKQEEFNKRIIDYVESEW